MPSGFQLARDQSEAYEAHTGVFMGESARLLAAGSSIQPGSVVLDLACGTGLVARHVAELVGPDGRVVGADINPAMIAVAGDHGPTMIEWIEAPAHALPFDDATFTHVICQQGLQFFPNAIAAASEVRRVLRPGGVFVATVWATPGHNPYIEQQLGLLTERDTSVAASAQRATPPAARSFLIATARAGGFDDVAVDLLEHCVDVPDLESWFLSQTSGTPWGPTIAALDEDSRAALATEMSARLADYATPAGHSLPFGSYRLIATRAAGDEVRPN